LKKKFFKIVRKRYKKSGILRRFQNYAEVLSLAKGNNLFYRKTDYLILTFNPPKNVAPPLIRVEKKFLQKSAQRVSKEVEFCADFKNAQKS
jgi:hypothetical protein